MNGGGRMFVLREMSRKVYFEPLADQLGLSDSPGGGRKPLAEKAARRINVIRQKCSDDFDALIPTH